MAINMLVEKLCREEAVGFAGKFCWKGGYVHEGWASSKWKGGSSICGWTLSMGSITNIFGSKHYLN